MAVIETDMTAYTGNMNAFAFEGPAPIFAPKNVIRSDQDWGVKVEWEMQGPLVTWLDANFRLTVHLEGIGVAGDHSLPFVAVHTLSAPLNAGPPASRKYEEIIDIPAGTIPPGVYKLVTTLHLYESATNNPTPVAGFVEGGMINIFDPA